MGNTPVSCVLPLAPAPGWLLLFCLAPPLLVESPKSVALAAPLPAGAADWVTVPLIVKTVDGVVVLVDGLGFAGVEPGLGVGVAAPALVLFVVVGLTTRWMSPLGRK